jgi:uncharacterized membrane protein YbhN (UPF0104 family)
MATASTSGNLLLHILQRRKISIVAVVLIVGLLYASVPQLGFFDSNRQTLLHSDWRLVGLSVGCLLVSFAAASIIYGQLSPRPLRFGATYLVQIASAFAGKVLPAGLGSISVNYLYLRRQGCRQAVSATVVAVNNLLGFVGHGLWLVLVAALLSGQLHGVVLQGVNGWVVAGVTVGLVLLLLVGVTLRWRLRRAIGDVMSQLRTYRHQPNKLVIALGASMMLTACNIAIVWLSSQALQVPLTVLTAAVALTTGVLAQTVTPTPGGLGGVEVGLVGGLMLAGTSLENAIAVTIMYRLVTYWLPLLLGGAALLIAVRRRLL